MNGPGARLSDAQLLDWLQLIRSDNIGPRTFQQLVNRYGGAAAALAALPDLIARTPGARKVRIASRDACTREMEAVLALGAQFVALGEPDYPQWLRAIPSAPPLICVRGRTEVLHRPAVAIVGARNASAAGLAFADRLVGGLASRDYAIVSGLARGIDQRAHRASLASGTIAVLAGGLDRIYPPEHETLARQICEGGALISEMPLGTVPRGRDFPRRNRIVSGIAMATVVIEAARRSGSLITSRFANEQGREVFAVPGSPLDPRAEGTNDLLRQGATLCTGADDVIEALEPLLGRPAPGQDNMQDGAVPGSGEEPLWDETDLFGQVDVPTTIAGHEFDDAEPALSGLSVADGAEAGVSVTATPSGTADLLSLLGPSPVAIDELVRASGLAAADVQTAIMELELRAGRPPWRRAHIPCAGRPLISVFLFTERVCEEVLTGHHLGFEPCEGQEIGQGLKPRVRGKVLHFRGQLGDIACDFRSTLDVLFRVVSVRALRGRGLFIANIGGVGGPFCNGSGVRHFFGCIACWCPTGSSGHVGTSEITTLSICSVN